MTMLASLLVCAVTVEGLLRLFPGMGFRLADPSFFTLESGFSYHPDLGYTLVPDAVESRSYRDDDCSTRHIEVRTNHFGLRGPDVVADGRPRIVFIGDSFTEGYHVDEPETFTAVTGDLLSGRVVPINCGIRNYDVIQYMHMLRFAREHLEPTMIIVGVFVGNDVAGYSRSAYYPPMTSVAAMRSLRSSSYLLSWLARVGRTPSDDTQPARAPEARHPLAGSLHDLRTGPDCGAEDMLDHADNYIRWRSTPGHGPQYSDPMQAYSRADRTAMVLADMQAELGDTPLLVLIIPERMQVKDDEWRWLQEHLPDRFVDRQGTIEKLARALRRRDVDYTNLLDVVDESCYLRFDGHFSTVGHRRVGEHVAQLVRTRYATALSPGF